MLGKAKLALRITTSAYDDEIIRLVLAGLADLGFADVEATALTAEDAVTQAVITYVRLNFGTPDDYDRLKRSYDEQKAQLQIHALNGGGDDD